VISFTDSPEAGIPPFGLVRAAESEKAARRKVARRTFKVPARPLLERGDDGKVRAQGAGGDAMARGLLETNRKTGDD
jgi:hypothetical protein